MRQSTLRPVVASLGLLAVAFLVAGAAHADTGYSNVFTIDLRTAAPSISSFTATPSQITAGQPTTLAWASTGGTSASIDNGVGAVATSGTKAVSPTITTTYTLSVTGAGGTTTMQVTVSVGTAPPQISSFTASASEISAGVSVTLAWVSTGGTSASIDQGVGPVPMTGSTTVAPALTTTYTLTVTNAAGKVTQQVTVSVLSTSGPPPTLFAHGICSTGATWQTMASNLNKLDPRRFPTSNLVHLYFDGKVVRDKNDSNLSHFFDPASRTNSLSVSPDTLLFTIWYWDAASKTLESDQTPVTGVSIWSLGDQLAYVVEAIQAITGSPTVDIVSHSMGGLVSRVYLENMGQVPYQPGSVRRLITIDTPHGGFYKPLFDALGQMVTESCQRGNRTDCVLQLFFSCAVSDSLQKNQMDLDQPSLLLDRLNHVDIPGDIFVVSWATKGGVLGAAALPDSDGIVTLASQDLKQVTSALDSSHEPHYLCAKNIYSFKWWEFDALQAHTNVINALDSARNVGIVLEGTTYTEQGCETLPHGQTKKVSGSPSAGSGTATVTVSFWSSLFGRTTNAAGAPSVPT